ncbi:MAG: hypothetical protein AB2992_07210 (plasmid) [Candidatus Symbiodolus clandestinus]
MRYEEVIKGLISSVKLDDPDAAFKKLQIKRWGHLWWMLADCQSHLDLFIQVLSDETCWDKTEDFYKIKLNINQLGKKLINPDTTYYSTRHKSIRNNPLMFDDLYRIACWCCLEDDIHRLFNQELQDRPSFSEEEIVDFISGRNRGPLMIFWSHYINKDKYPVRNRERWTDEYGFECAMAEKHVEALEFFWERIQSNTAFSLEKKEQLLFNVALYESLNGRANVAMIEFCLHHLNPNRYADLLKADFNKNKCYLTLSELRSGHSIEYTKLLFSILKPEDVSFSDYSSSFIHGALIGAAQLSSDYNYFIEAHNELVILMLNRPGFETHKQHFLDRISGKFASFNREVLANLVKRGFASAVWEILDSASPTQRQSIMKSETFKNLDKLVDFIGDKDTANQLRKYHAIGDGALGAHEPSNISQNVESLGHSMSAVTIAQEDVMSSTVESLSDSPPLHLHSASGAGDASQKPQEFS